MILHFSSLRRLLAMAWAFALGALPAGAAVLVSDFNQNSVFRYGDGGAYEGTLISAGSGGLSLPHRSRIGPDGVLYVASAGTDSILRYNASTGAYLGSFVTAASGIDYPVDMIFRNDGFLYVSSQLTDSILRFDATTGARDLSWSAQAPSLDGPSGIAFDAVGNLYVAGRFSNNVVRFSANGTFSAVLGTVSSAFGLALLPDQRLVAASGTGGSVQAFSNPSGTPTQANFVSGSLSFPVGVELTASGQLLVADYGAAALRLYSSETGASLGNLTAGGPLSGPNFVTVVPEPSSALLIMVGVMIAGLGRRRRTA